MAPVLEKMMDKTLSRHIRGILVSATILVLAGIPAASAVPLVNSYLNSSWADANKPHDQTLNSWGINYWDDANSNNLWDKTEPIAESIMAGWANPKFDKDLSCWIASAADMLASAGFAGGQAQDIYWDMIYNMSTPWFSGGWQFGGWQHEALNWYLANRPHPLGGSYEVAYYGIYNNQDGSAANAWPNNSFDFAANILAAGDEVGIVVHGAIYHAITFQGYDDAISRIDITDSDRDAYPNALGLDPYFYDRDGATQWRLTDYISGPITVDYFATLRHVPTPGSTALLAIGLAALAFARWRNT